MTDLSAEAKAPAAAPGYAGDAPWTCPFCPLLCDRFGVAVADVPVPALTLLGSDCPKAQAGLARLSGASSAPRPSLRGQACSLEDAIAAAARLLAVSRQPLFGGLGTDVAGARALYALACRTGAISDPAHGEALMTGLRALQDRGRYATTLAEVHERADLVVLVTGDPRERYPMFFERCGLAPDDPRCVSVLSEPGQDLFDAISLLAAAVEKRALNCPMPDALRQVAERLSAASYAVIVYETGRLPAHGALIVETLNRIVGSLNRSTRAAVLAPGGGEGASTVNEVYTWLSGLPLRSRAGPAGLQHEPLCFEAERLLADGAVDALLWVDSYGANAVPATAGLPCIVLGVADRADGTAADVFIPVATPGINGSGHLFRVDGSVVLPLRPVRDDGLPSVEGVVRRLDQALAAQAPGAAP